MNTPHPIGIDDLSRLGIDNENVLYWDGKPLATEQRVSLSWWVNTAVIAGGFSTAIMAVLAVVKAIRC